MLGKPINYRSSAGADFIINDRQYDSLMVSPYYYIHVDTVDGLFGADIAHESHPIPNHIGEKSGDVFRRAKTITLSGNIYARSLGPLYAASYFMQEMLADKGQRQLRFTPWNFQQQLYIECRPYQDLSIVMNFNAFDTYRWAFTFGLRADDPRTRLVSGGTVYPTWQQ